MATVKAPWNFIEFSIAELDNVAVKEYFQSQGASGEYEQILALALINRAILMGYEQNPDEAGPLFERAHKMIVNRPDAMTLELARSVGGMGR